MPGPERNSPPDVVVGRHPRFGIVATNPKNLAASAWMLKGFGFQPVPGHPSLYTLADQQRDGRDRAARFVTLLRNTRYRVDADVEFDPALAAPRPVPARATHVEPEVAFAEHPQLGIIVAIDGDERGSLLLQKHGWRHHPGLDIYALPAHTNRGEAIRLVAQATAAMHRAGLHVALQPSLARDVTAHRTSTPNTTARPERSTNQAAHGLRLLNAAALAASPARAALPDRPPTAPTATAPPVGPVDPRIAFSHNR